MPTTRAHARAGEEPAGPVPATTARQRNTARAKAVSAAMQGGGDHAGRTRSKGNRGNMRRSFSAPNLEEGFDNTI